jgi:hypothetical protein
MPRITISFIFLLISLTFSSPFYWTDAGSDGKWSNPLNWTPYGVPGSSNDVDLLRTDGLGITLDTTDTIQNVYCDGSNLNVVQLYFAAGKSLYVADSNANFIDNHGIFIHYVKHSGCTLGLLSPKTTPLNTLANDTLPNLYVGGGITSLGNILYCDTITTSGGTFTTNNNDVFCNGFYDYTYLNAGASTITINGDFHAAWSTFNSQTSTIKITNASNLLCNDGFYNFTAASNLHTINMLADFFVTHGLTIDSSMISGNRQLLFLLNNGAYYLSIDTISNFSAMNNLAVWFQYFNTFTIPSNQHYPFLQCSQINYGYSTATVATGGLTCTTLMMQSSAGSSYMNFIFNNQTVKCNTLQVGEPYSTDHLGIYLGAGNLYIYGNANFSTGAGYDNFYLQTGNIYLYGNWLNTSVAGSVVDAGTSTVYFQGTSGTQQIQSNNFPFYNVNIGNGNSGATYVLDDSLQVDDTLRIDGDTLNSNNLPVYTSNLYADSGLFYANASNIYVNHDLIFSTLGSSGNGVFNCGTSTVYLTGSGHFQTLDGWNNRIYSLVQSNGDTTSVLKSSVMGNFTTGDSTSVLWSKDSAAEFRMVGILTNNGVKWGNGGKSLELGLGMMFGSGPSGNYGDCLLDLTSILGFGGNVSTTKDVMRIADSANTNGHNLTCNNFSLRQPGDSAHYNERLFITGSSNITVNGSIYGYGSDISHVQGFIVGAPVASKMSVAKNFNLQVQLGAYGNHSYLSLLSMPITFNGISGIDSIYSYGQAFGNGFLNAPGATTILLDSTYFTGNFTHTAGTFNPNGQKITVAGNYIDTSKFSSAYSGLAGSTFVVHGNAAFLGSLGNLLNLNALTTWYINVTGTLAAGYSTIGHSTAGLSTGHADSTCVNAGADVNWTFGGQHGLINQILRFFHIYRMG